MGSSPLRALLFVLSLTIGHVVSQDKSPGGPTHPGIAANCNAWHTVKSGDSCYDIETKYRISHANFLKWNPAVSNDCTTNFWAEYAYCVGVGATVSSSTTAKGTTTTTPRTTITSVSTTSIGANTSTIETSSFTTSVNTTYSVRVPITSWNVTTPTIETEFPPKKTQEGQPPYCTNWHYVSPGDTCETIVGSTSWASMKEFLAWNPTLNSDCSGLYVGWWVCIGIQPQTVTATFEYTITAPSVEVPPYTKFTPTTFPSADSSFTATPTSPGLAKQCQAFYQAEAGDTCRKVTANGFPSQEQFFEWNPALQKNCDGMWEGYWYCVAVSGVFPMPPRVTTTPSPVPTGQPSNCKSWYKTTDTETCDDIVAIFVAFSKKDFISWNPSVGPKCDGIRKGQFYCVGVPGTPTTRTGPVPTSTVPSDMPTQSGIASDCSDFWLVSKSDTCESIVNSNGISERQFLAWNPAVGASECSNLVPDFYVCVGVKGASNSVPITGEPTTGPTATSSSGSSLTSPVTSTSGGPVSTPVPVQGGMVSGCRRFYKAQSGDGCYDIASAARISLDDFYKWNPAVGKECASLWLDYWYCIGIAGPGTTISSGPPVPT